MKRVPYPCDRGECAGRKKECWNYKVCGKWYSWFVQEWDIIRKASEKIKINDERQ